MTIEYFNTKPAKHQLDGIQFAKDRNYSVLWNWDTGTGKTRAALEYCLSIAQHNREQQGTKPIGIIFVPSNLLPNWKEECVKHYHPLINKRVWNYEDTPKSHSINKKSEHLLTTDYGLYIAGISYMRNKNFLNACLKKRFTFFVVDESHNLKSSKSIQTKGFLVLSKQVKHKLLMTGSPILNSIEDVWSQVAIASPNLLPRTYYAFLNKYFVDVHKWMKDRSEPKETRDRYYPNWVLMENLRDDLFKILDGVMSVVNKDECVDLPDYIRQKVFCEMDGDTKREYTSMLNTLRAELKGKEITADNTLVKVLRLQQIIAMSKAKLDLCVETMESIDLTKHKVIVWCNFRDPIVSLEEVLAKRFGSDSIIVAHGGIEKSERFALIKSFNNDTTKRIIICTQGALGTGFELTAASYAYYHSKGYKLGDNLQSEGRNYRRGSNIHDKVVRIDALVKGSLDVTIHRALEKKKGLHDMAKDIGSYIGI